MANPQIQLHSGRYYDWLDKLYELMEWTPAEDGDPRKVRWKCGDPETGDRLALARQAALALGADFDALMAESREHAHACCDCELILNADDR